MARAPLQPHGRSNTLYRIIIIIIIYPSHLNGFAIDQRESSIHAIRINVNSVFSSLHFFIRATVRLAFIILVPLHTHTHAHTSASFTYYKKRNVTDSTHPHAAKRVCEPKLETLFRKIVGCEHLLSLRNANILDNWRRRGGCCSRHCARIIENWVNDYSSSSSSSYDKHWKLLRRMSLQLARCVFVIRNISHTKWFNGAGVTSDGAFMLASAYRSGYVYEIRLKMRRSMPMVCVCVCLWRSSCFFKTWNEIMCE